MMTNDARLYFTIFIALMTGAGLTWGILRGKIAQAKASLLNEQSTLTATLKVQLENSERINRDFRTELLAVRERATNLGEENAALRSTLQSQKQFFAEKLALTREWEEKIQTSFKALSADALNRNNSSFLHLAKNTLEKFQTTARSDLDGRQLAIDQLVKPLHESLVKVDNRIGELEKARTGAYARLDEQLQSLLTTQAKLESETGNLVKALRAPTIRGRWGEIQLRRVVELAGMVNYCDFMEQETASGNESRLRPDLVIKLPTRKNIVVDSKAPLQAYLAALEAENEQEKREHLKTHARQIRTHMQQLSEKRYWDQFEPTPEFVVLFLPGESFFSAALEHDPSLIEFGVDKKVLLATPISLIALLRAVAYGWRQEQLAENAQQISALGKEMYERLLTVTSHVANLGKGLDRAVDSYNRAVSSLDTRVLVTARKFKELGASSAGDMESPEPIDKVTRRLESLGEI
ncbi:MAG: DNA recombination protein RmuC [Desulfuromonadales bacterium]|nr:DNA recombination protein RmuC [Desulfuromonadales bacterium]